MQNIATPLWYDVPSFLLAALIYTMIGRYVLELIFARKPDVVILKVFRSVTDPIAKLVRFITPAIVPNGLVVVFSIAWLMAARMFWFLTAVAAGMKLTVSGG